MVVKFSTFCVLIHALYFFRNSDSKLNILQFIFRISFNFLLFLVYFVMAFHSSKVEHFSSFIKQCLIVRRSYQKRKHRFTKMFHLLASQYLTFFLHVYRLPLIPSFCWLKACTCTRGAIFPREAE